MRIRTHLRIAAGVGVVVASLVVGALVYMTHRAQASIEEQAQSQEVVRGVANLLSLTNEFAVYGSERAATQWRARHAELLAATDRAARLRERPLPDLLELRQEVSDLAGLFDALARTAPDPADDLARRRRELLLERMLIETQGVVESRHRWALAVEAEQRRDQRLYTAMVLLSPGMLLGIGVWFGLLVRRRVLVPVGELEATVTAMRGGNLAARCGSAVGDEIGDAARAVDAMAQALQERTAALSMSQARLQLVTDNIPAFVAHVDAQERYMFVNAHFARAGIGEPAALVGRTIREVHGEDAHALLAPHIARVLAGEVATFETTHSEGGRVVHRQSTYVPDVAEGRVRGFFALSFDVTERKEIELRLAASERMLHNVTANQPALMAYIDHDRRYRFVNERAREWLGAAPQDVIGKAVCEIVGADRYALIEPRLDQALRGERVRWERQVTRDGKVEHQLAEYIPDIGPDGIVRGCYGLVIDISERKAAELAIAESEQRLLDLTNSIPAMVAYFDMQERCQFANDTALTVHGVDRARVPGITLREAQGEDSYAQHEPHVREVLAGRRAGLTGKVRMLGREKHFQTHLVPDRVEGGAQRGFYIMTFDITALKAAQQQQALAERQLRAITNNLPVLISYIDRNERILFLNETYRQWVGIDPAAVIGLPMSVASRPEHYAQRRDHLRRALRGERVEFEVETVTLGIKRSLQNIYIPDIQPDGTVAGIYTLSTDVSALKAVEEQLRELTHVDSLTGLPNRRRVEEQLREAITRSSRNRRPLAVMFLDIDHFKAINDSLGHAAGDAVLRQFAFRLRGAVRTTDTAARLAGDEFVILLEGLNDEREAELIARKVVAVMREPFDIDGTPLPVTTSVGVAYCGRPRPDSPLLALADNALYAAKSAGRDTYAVRHLEAMHSVAGTL